MVTSAHVLFDEVLPTPSTSYHAELEELARVKVVPGEGRTLESYSYLIHTRHRDDENNLLYEVKSLPINRELSKYPSPSLPPPYIRHPSPPLRQSRLSLPLPPPLFPSPSSYLEKTQTETPFLLTVTNWIYLLTIT